MNAAATVILSAPQGSGKTRRAKALARHFGCQRVLDEWAPGDPVLPGTLHLTNTFVEEAPDGVLLVVMNRRALTDLGQRPRSEGNAA